MSSEGHMKSHTLSGVCTLLLGTALITWFTCAAAGEPQGKGFSVFTPEYRAALPGYRFEFPRDHGAHPEFKLEWWYVIGQLQGPDDRRFGYELTFFRRGLERRSDNPSRWNARELHLAHFAWSELVSGDFHFYEKVNRNAPGVASAASGRLDLHNAGWTLRMQGTTLDLSAQAERVALRLSLEPRKPPVIHGSDGISRKGTGVGRASHYYSMTRLATQGVLDIEGSEIPVQGESWLDHEFGTNQLAENQMGWDWFSIQLDNGEELMLYRIRLRDESADPASSGTIVDPAANPTHLASDSFHVSASRSWRSPRSGATYPVDWTVEIESLDAHLRVVPIRDDQELVTTRSTGIAYWEGAVRVDGIWRGAPAHGKGYVELTGYGPDSRPDV